jgi:hypothetical protein
VLCTLLHFTLFDYGVSICKFYQAANVSVQGVSLPMQWCYQVGLHWKLPMLLGWLFAMEQAGWIKCKYFYGKMHLCGRANAV